MVGMSGHSVNIYLVGWMDGWINKSYWGKNGQVRFFLNSTYWVLTKYHALSDKAPQQLCEIRTISSPSLEMRKLRLGEVQQLSQGATANKW